MNDQEVTLFTASSLLDFLLQIDELKDYDIGVDEQSNKIIVSIGDSTYEINTSDAEEIPVEDEYIDIVEDANEDTFNTILEDEDTEKLESVESGLIKEAIKSMLLGGMIRLSSKLLKS